MRSSWGELTARKPHSSRHRPLQDRISDRVWRSTVMEDSRPSVVDDDAGHLSEAFGRSAGPAVDDGRSERGASGGIAEDIGRSASGGPDVVALWMSARSRRTRREDGTDVMTNCSTLLR